MKDSIDPVLDHLEKIFKLLNDPIFRFSDSSISISKIIISILVFFLAVRLAKFLGKTVNRSLQKKSVDSGVRDSLEKFVRYSVVALGILFSLDNLGVSINSLAAVGAVLMVGIGFGLQNITQNFISGIILLIERPIKVGDIIQVGSATGRVIDIRVRSTIIQTRDDVTIIVPNSKLVSEDVINDSYTGQKIRQHIKVGVAYGSDVTLVTKLLVKAAEENPKVLNEPKPIAVFADFGESSFDFDLRFWCTDIWQMDLISGDIRVKIDAFFRENNVEIPFPQRDLHIKSGLKS